MFPKFLRVAACFGWKETVWINETSFIEKAVLHEWDEIHLDIIADALGFSYEAKFPSDDEKCGRRLANGTWTGMFGMLQRDEVDMAVDMGKRIDEEMSEEFRLSHPHSISEVTFITRKPEHVPNMAVFLYPFSIQVWFAILAFVCLVPFIFHYLLRKKNSAPNLLTSVLGSLVGQGMSLTPRKIREYFVLASWILGSTFLYFFYAGVLLSFITFPPLQGIRTVEDLANGIEAGKYECATYPGAEFSVEFIQTEIPAFTLIGNALKYDFDFIEYLELSGGSKKPAFVGHREHFDDYKDYYYVPEENFLFSAFSYVTRKDFCCCSELDKAIHRAWESGIFKKIVSYYEHFFYTSKHYSKNWDPPSETKLTMELLKGPFIFLIASLSLACLVFLIEVCIGKFQKQELKC